MNIIGYFLEEFVKIYVIILLMLRKIISEAIWTWSFLQEGNEFNFYSQ